MSVRPEDSVTERFCDRKVLANDLCFDFMPLTVNVSVELSETYAIPNEGVLASL